MLYTAPQLILICPAPLFIMACSPLPHLACYDLYIPPPRYGLFSPLPQLIIVCPAPHLVMVCSAPSPHLLRSVQPPTPPTCYCLFSSGWSKMATVGPKMTANRFRSPKKPRVQSFSSIHKPLSEFCTCLVQIGCAHGIFEFQVKYFIQNSFLGEFYTHKNFKLTKVSAKMLLCVVLRV